MEEKKKTNVAKIIFRVIGIILSIVLIPALIFGIPASGVLIGVSNTVSQENLAGLVGETDLSDQVLDIVKEEVVKGIHSDEANEEYLQNLVLDSITADWVDSVITEVLDAVYFGRTPNVKMDSVTEALTAGIDELEQNGFQDLYSAWKNDTPSVYFSETFVQSFRDKVEQEILTEYAQYEAGSLEELETKYDTYYGAGSFAKLVDEKVVSFEEEWKQAFSEEIGVEIEKMAADTQQEINDALAEAVQDPDVRMVFDSLKDLNEKASTWKLIVYGVMFGAVVLLVACFWFGISGFVVSAVPLILAGFLCKAVSGVESFVLNYVSDITASDATLSQFGTAINKIVGGLLKPVFAEVSALGNVSIITGVVLIGLAIMVGVMKKNKAVTE